MNVPIHLLDETTFPRVLGAVEAHLPVWSPGAKGATAFSLVIAGTGFDDFLVAAAATEAAKRGLLLQQGGRFFKRATLRPYQREAVKAVVDRIEADRDPTLLAGPVGSGKSLMLAATVCELARRHPGARFLLVVATEELVVQDHDALAFQSWPGAPAGIVCAGLGRQDFGAPVRFCSVQSLRRNLHKLGHVDFLLIDEAHNVLARRADADPAKPLRKDAPTYARLVHSLRSTNPNMRIIGTTGTPYRLGQGLLTDEIRAPVALDYEPADDYERTELSEDGKRATCWHAPLFKDVCHEIDMAMLIGAGFLAEPIGYQPATLLDAEAAKVRTKAGDFSEADLSEKFNTDELNRTIVSEVVAAGTDRKAWIAFCIDIDHARAVAAEFRRQGVPTAVLVSAKADDEGDEEHVDGETPPTERAEILAAFKAGKLRCVVNVNMLSVGFDHPAIDLVALLRPTKSTVLYVQQVGRGMRRAPGKTDVLVLDFARNVFSHGPVDTAKQGTPGALQSPPMKACPACRRLVPGGVTHCPCGHEFEIERQHKMPEARADTSSKLISGGERQATLWRAPVRGGFPAEIGLPEGWRLVEDRTTPGLWSLIEPPRKWLRNHNLRQVATALKFSADVINRKFRVTLMKGRDRRVVDYRIVFDGIGGRRVAATVTELLPEDPDKFAAWWQRRGGAVGAEPRSMLEFGYSTSALPPTASVKIDLERDPSWIGIDSRPDRSGRMAPPTSWPVQAIG